MKDVLKNEQEMIGSFTTVEKINRLVEKFNLEDENETDESSKLVSFELVVGFLFPNAYEKMKESLTQKFIEGYDAAIDKLKRNKKEVN